MKILKLLIFIMLFFIFIPIVLADDVRITLVDYEPRPVVPGNFFTATFRVDNIAGKNLTNIDIELDHSNIFFVEGSDKLTINSLEEGGSVTFTFNIGVRSSATSGFKNINIDWDTITDSGDETFSIQIKDIETTLVVESVESIPTEISPGEEATIKIKLKNNANIILKNIRVKLNLNSTELPFAPIGTVTERNIDNLQADSSSELEFKIITLADASSKIYKIPLEINYFDEFGNEFQITDVIGLIVGSKPILDINIESSNLIAGRQGTVSIDIVNRGLTHIKFLNAKLLPLENFVILSSDTVYVGDIDSDDVESIDFNLIVGEEGFINLPLQLIYRDANNKLYFETFNVQARVYNINEAKRLGLIKTNRTLIIISGLILLIIIYFILRRFFRRKR